MELRDIIEHNTQVDKEMSDLRGKLKEIHANKKFPTENELTEYLLEQGFTRVHENFQGINLSSVSKYLEKNPVFYHPKGYIFEISKRCCGCRLAEGDGIDYVLSKIKKMKKRTIKKAITSLDINTTFMKEVKRSFLFAFIGAAISYIICRNSGVKQS